MIVTDLSDYGNIENGRHLGVMEGTMEPDAARKRIRKDCNLLASIYDPEVISPVA